jgi:TolB-like protein/Tfp pilus assembly protein PilF
VIADRARLLALAEAIADGRAVDWNAEESQTSSVDDRLLVRQLQLLAGVAAANRACQQDGEGTDSASTRIEARRWGPLELRECLGAGAFGTVHRAWDPRLARDVALKLFPAHPFDGSNAPHVIEEGQLLARVRHPNVITVYGAGRYDHQVGIWMELIRGSTLEQLLRQHGPFSAKEAAAVGVDLCGALAAVHRARLIHRDVKTQNVMREEGGRIVLMDFGAGQDLGPIRGERRVGTPAYMAPELFDGAAASPRSDVYSLGVLLFRLVTAEYPVPGGTTEKVRAAHASSSRRRLVDLRADLPALFVAAVERALSPHAEDRFETAAEMQSTLVRVADQAAAPTAGHRVRRWRWTRVAVALLSAIALAAAIPFAKRLIIGGFVDSPVIDIAVLPFEKRPGDQTADYFADGVTDILVSRLGMIDSLRVIARTSVNALGPDERHPAAIFRRLGAEYAVEGSVERNGDRVRVVARLIQSSAGTLHWTQTYERPLGDLFALEGEIAAAIASAVGSRLTGDITRRLLGSQTSSVLAQDGYLQARYLIYTFDRTRFTEARRLLEEAVAIDPNYAIAHASLSRVYGLLLDGDLGDARDLVPLAVAAAARAAEADAHLAESQVALADSKYKYERDWAASAAAYERALALAPNASIVRAPYVRYLCAVGRLDEALAHALAGSDADPLSAEMIAAIGIAHYYRREFDQALRQYQRAAALAPTYGPVYFGMARAYSGKGDYATAVEHVRKAISLVGEHPTYLAELARNYALGGWRNSAEQVLGGLLRMANEGPPVSYDGIGYAFAALGDLDRAFEWLNRSLDHYFARLLFLKVDPRADRLRGDRRFGALLARVGLTP